MPRLQDLVLDFSFKAAKDGSRGIRAALGLGFRLRWLEDNGPTKGTAASTGVVYGFRLWR